MLLLYSNDMVGSNLNRLASLTLAVILLVSSTVGAIGYVFASSTGSSANLDQCVNGAVKSSTGPCLDGSSGGTTYSDWVNGNSNGAKSHWKEGQFIAYRTYLSSLGR